jgi:MFS family permease
MRGYVIVLRTPGLVVPVLATVIGALPLGMLGLGLLLYVHAQTGSLSDAGLAAGAFGVGNALGLTAQGPLIDRFGMSRVIAPAGVMCAAWTALAVAATPTVGSMVFTVPVSAAAGGCVPATTGSMRVLLTMLITDDMARRSGYALLAVLFQLALLAGPLVTSLLWALLGAGATVATGGALAGAGGLLFASAHASRHFHTQTNARATTPPKQHGLPALLILTTGMGVSAGLVAVAVPAAALAHGAAAASGPLIAMSSAGEIVAGFTIGLRQRWSPPGLLLVALCGSAMTASLAAGLADSLALLLPAMCLTGTCTGPFAVAASSLLDTVAPRAALARSYTLMVGLGLLGTSAGNVLGGTTVDTSGYRLLFALNACWLTGLVATGVLIRRFLHLPPSRSTGDCSYDRSSTLNSTNSSSINASPG